MRNDSISLDARVSATENDSALIDLVAGESNLMEDLELVVRSDFIDQMLAALEPVDRILVVGHFALDGGEPQTLSADWESGGVIEGAHQAEVESGD